MSLSLRRVAVVVILTELFLTGGFASAAVQIKDGGGFFKAETLRKADAKLDEAVVTKVLERTDLSKPLIGDEQKQVITAAGGVLKQNHVISSATNVNSTVDDLIDPQYARIAVGKNLAQK